MTSAKTNKYHMIKHFLLRGVVVTHTSVTRPEQALSAETFFSCQNVMSTGFDKFWSQQVPRYDCNPKSCSNSWVPGECGYLKKLYEVMRVLVKALASSLHRLCCLLLCSVLPVCLDNWPEVECWQSVVASALPMPHLQFTTTPQVFLF